MKSAWPPPSEQRQTRATTDTNRSHRVPPEFSKNSANARQQAKIPTAFIRQQLRLQFGPAHLCRDGGTGNFGGFRSSCTNNLIVADGILAAPDYTRTCTCSYQNQCSIAFVPMPEAEIWTFYGKAGVKKAVKRVGINFGAPGDRRAADGTLWLEYPGVGGASPAVPVHVNGGQVEYFRRHQSAVTGDMPWVACSGVEGAESVAVKLLPTEMPDTHYTVRLHFIEPDDLKPGERVFDVTLQGRRVLDDFDPVKEAGKPRHGIFKEFRSVRVDDELRLSFKSLTKYGAVLCGIEVVQE